MNTANYSGIKARLSRREKYFELYLLLGSLGLFLAGAVVFLLIRHYADENWIVANHIVAEAGAGKKTRGKSWRNVMRARLADGENTFIEIDKRWSRTVASLSTATQLSVKQAAERSEARFRDAAESARLELPEKLGFPEQLSRLEDSPLGMARVESLQTFANLLFSQNIRKVEAMESTAARLECGDIEAEVTCALRVPAEGILFFISALSSENTGFYIKELQTLRGERLSENTLLTVTVVSTYTGLNPAQNATLFGDPFGGDPFGGGGANAGGVFQ